MSATLLTVHSLLPWLVLGVLAARGGASTFAWVRGRDWTEHHRRLGLAVVAVVDAQVLVGVAIVATRPDVAGQALAASRHVAIMGLAAVAVHVGHAVGKRAGLDLDRHRIAAGSSALALLLLLGGLAR